MRYSIIYVYQLSNELKKSGVTKQQQEFV